MANTFKKFLALVLVLSLVMGMTGMAYAADDTTEDAIEDVIDTPVAEDEIIEDEPLPVDNTTESGTIPTEDGDELETSVVTDEVAAEEVSEIMVGTATDLAQALNTQTITQITLINDIDMSDSVWIGAVVASGRTLVIDGDGHTISGMVINEGNKRPNGTGVVGDGGSCDYYAGFIANNEGNLTIKNLTFTKALVDIDPVTVNADSTGSSILAVVCGNNRGTLRFEDVTVTDSVVKGYTKVGILHGYTQGKGNTFVAERCTVTGSTVQLEADGSAPLPLSGGILIGYNAGNRSTTNGIHMENNHMVIDDEIKAAYGNYGYTLHEASDGGYYISYGDTTYNVITATYAGNAKETRVSFVAEVGGFQYETIHDAIDAATSGQTVTLLNDATESVVIASGKEITLDLNGNMLTGAKNAKGEMANVITNRGILTIKDSSGDNSGTVMGGTDTNQEGNVGRKGIAVVNEIGATCTIESGTIKRGDDGTFGNYTVQNKSKMYIKGGLITNNSNKSNLVVNYNRSADGKQFGTEDVYMEISGGTVRQTSMSAIKNEPGSVLHITGEATVIERTMGEKNTNFASNFYGTVIMDGGTLTTDGLLGFFSHKNPDGTEFAGDFTITGDAKVVCNEIRLENGISGGVTAAVPTLTISGNVSVTANNLYQLRVDGNKLYTVSDNIANIDISGGTFNKDVIKYVIPNYKTLDNNNGTWTVVPNYVACIGNNPFMSLKEAVNAPYASGNTIELLRSTTESVVIPSDKNITLDLNGHTLTAANSHAITNNGELTIVDSSDGKTGKVDGGEVAGSGAIFNNIEAIATLNGGTFTGSKWYVIKNLGNMTIAEGAVVDQKDNGSSGIDNGWYNSLLTDGHVNDCGVPHIDADLVAELTITGGTFTGGLNTVKNDDYGTLNIQGGTHSNTTQHVIMNWNVATISGGTFIASDAATLAVWNNDSSKNNTSNQGSMSISGGMFSSAVKPDWCATGYLPTNGGSTEGAPYSVDRSTITLTADPASVTGSRTVALIVSAPENLEGEIVVTGATGAPAPEKGSDDRTWTVSVPNADATYAFNVGLKLSDGTVRNFNSATVSVTRYVAPGNPSTPSTPDEPDEPVVDIEDDPTALGDRPFIFEDVHEQDWFYDDVKSIFENGLINGTTTTTYEPQTELTRGMIVTILWRIAGEPTVEATSTFADVPENAYYFNAINWGAANNIARGYDEETFAPDRLVSREELAAFIYRYSELIELDLTGIDEEAFAEFGDAESVLPWFVENMKWAISAGIVKGEDGMLLPQDRATRAEAAAMVNRFIQMPEVAAIMQANAEAETATDAE